MGEMLKIALAAVFGIGVFVAGQILQRLVIEPIQEQRRTIGRVAHALVYFANVSYRVGDKPDLNDQPILKAKIEEAEKHLRNLAAELRASTWVIPFYSILSKCAGSVLLKKETIYLVAAELIGWSNHMVEERDGLNEKYRNMKEIKRLLNFRSE